MIKKVVICIIVFCSVTLSRLEILAQNKKIDSLLNALKITKEDTNKARQLISLGWEYIGISKYDSCLIISNRAAELSSRLDYKKGLSGAFGNIGFVYYSQGNYPQALDFYFKALKIAEELNDKRAMSRHFGNTGIVYRELRDYEKTLEYYFKALKIDEELHNKSGMAKRLSNIGNVYYKQGNNVLALDYYQRALKIDEELKDKKGIATEMGNIGSVYSAIGEYSEALRFFTKALAKREELGAPNLIASALGNIGSLYFDKQDYEQSELYLLKALAIDTTIGFLSHAQNTHEYLSRVYEKTNRYNKAFYHYKKAIELKDSITNDENIKKQTQLEMNYEFEKQQIADSIKNFEQIKQENLKHEQEIKEQKMYTYGGIIGFVLMLIVAGVSFRAFKQKQKTNIIIALQKEIVEEKQKEILDSIHYAKRIQRSLLPTEKYINKKLKELRKEGKID